MTNISEDVMLRARRYQVKRIPLQGVVQSVSSITADDDGKQVGTVLYVDISALAGISVVLPQVEIPANLHPVLRQLVGHEIGVLLRRVSGATAYASYREALERRRPVPNDGTATSGIIRAVMLRHLYVEAGNMIYVIPRHLATQSRVDKLTAVYQPGQRVVVAPAGKDGIRVVQHDPWASLTVKSGDCVAGTIIDTFPHRNYVLIEIEPGLQGIANMPLRGSVIRGDRVAAYVATIDPDERKMRLRISRKLPKMGDGW